MLITYSKYGIPSAQHGLRKMLPLAPSFNEGERLGSVAVHYARMLPPLSPLS